MATNLSSEEQLYELFLMGLMWLRESNPNVLIRRGSTIFASYVEAGVLPRSVRGLVEQSYTLMGLVKDRSEIVVRGRYLRSGELQTMIDASELHNIVLTVPSEDIILEKLFAPDGYAHAITSTGIEYAMVSADRYTGLVDASKFLNGWGQFKSRMRNLNASDRRRAQDVGEGDGSYGIPRAPHGEEDFDW